jgi:hypothetical protein
MSSISLRQHEHEVEQSRARLSHDLTVLCSPATLTAFTDDLKQEVFEQRDALWEKIKARAASNPAAVMAIGSGLAWRLLRSPPIASALIGVGLWSLWKTQPRTAYDASGRRLDYAEQSKEVLKEQAGQMFSAASDIAGKAQEAAVAKGSEVWEGAKERMQDWRENIGDSVAETASKLKTSGEALLTDIRAKRHDLRDEMQEVAAAAGDKVQDDDTRNTLLLAVAGVAIAGALGIACQKKISETLTD